MGFGIAVFNDRLGADRHADRSPDVAGRGAFARPLATFRARLEVGIWSRDSLRGSQWDVRYGAGLVAAIRSGYSFLTVAGCRGDSPTVRSLHGWRDARPAACMPLSEFRPDAPRKSAAQELASSPLGLPGRVLQGREDAGLL